jgi:hypothetical protein
MLEALLAIAETVIYLPDLFSESRAKAGCALAMLVGMAILILSIYFWVS